MKRCLGLLAVSLFFALPMMVAQENTTWTTSRSVRS